MIEICWTFAKQLHTSTHDVHVGSRALDLLAVSHHVVTDDWTHDLEPVKWISYFFKLPLQVINYLCEVQKPNGITF